MSKVLGALLVLTALGGCDSGDSDGGQDDRALVAELARSYNGALVHRCECLVEQDLLYDTVDACLDKLGWAASGESCIADAFEQHGSDELSSALRCHVGHLENATACVDSVSCEELLIDGACDETSASSPCGDAGIDLLAFVFEHCPQLDLHARQ